MNYLHYSTYESILLEDDPLSFLHSSSDDDDDGGGGDNDDNDDGNEMGYQYEIENYNSKDSIKKEKNSKKTHSKSQKFSSSLSPFQTLQKFLSSCSYLSKTFNIHPDFILQLMCIDQFDVTVLLNRLNNTSFKTLLDSLNLSTPFLTNTTTASKSSSIRHNRITPLKFDKIYSDYVQNYMQFGSHPNFSQTGFFLQNNGETNDETNGEASDETNDQNYEEIDCDICCDTFRVPTTLSRSKIKKSLNGGIINYSNGDSGLEGSICTYLYAFCGHLACLNCWYEHIMTSLSQGKLLIPCIYDDCKSYLTRSVIQWVIYIVTKFDLLKGRNFEGNGIFFGQNNPQNNQNAQIPTHPPPTETNPDSNDNEAQSYGYMQAFVPVNNYNLNILNNFEISNLVTLRIKPKTTTMATITTLNDDIGMINNNNNTTNGYSIDSMVMGIKNEYGELYFDKKNKFGGDNSQNSTQNLNPKNNGTKISQKTSVSSNWSKHNKDLFKPYNDLITVYDYLLLNSYIHIKNTQINSNENFDQNINFYYFFSQNNNSQNNPHKNHPQTLKLYHKSLPSLLRCRPQCSSYHTDISQSHLVTHNIPPANLNPTKSTTNLEKYNNNQIFSSFSTCSTCLTDLCVSCGNTYHSPLPCIVLDIWDEYMKANKGTQLWLIQNTKKCSNCHCLVEKSKGCNHITCYCGHEFCWVCGENWKSHIEVNRDRPINAYKCTSEKTIFQSNVNVNNNNNNNNSLQNNPNFGQNNQNNQNNQNVKGAVSSLVNTLGNNHNDEPSTPTLNGIGIGNGGDVENDIKNENNKKNKNNKNNSQNNIKNNNNQNANSLGLVWSVINHQYLSKRHYSSAFQYISLLYDTPRSMYLSRHDINGLDLIFYFSYLFLSKSFNLITNFDIFNFFLAKPNDFIQSLNNVVKNRQVDRLERTKLLQDKIDGLGIDDGGIGGIGGIGDIGGIGGIGDNGDHYVVILDDNNNNNNNNQNVEKNNKKDNLLKKNYEKMNYQNEIIELHYQQTRDKSMYYYYNSIFTLLSSYNDLLLTTQEQINKLSLDLDDDDNDDNENNDNNDNFEEEKINSNLNTNLNSTNGTNGGQNDIIHPLSPYSTLLPQLQRCYNSILSNINPFNTPFGKNQIVSKDKKLNLFQKFEKNLLLLQNEILAIFLSPHITFHCDDLRQIVLQIEQHFELYTLRIGNNDSTIFGEQIGNSNNNNNNNKNNQNNNNFQHKSNNNQNNTQNNQNSSTTTQRHNVNNLNFYLRGTVIEKQREFRNNILNLLTLGDKKYKLLNNWVSEVLFMEQEYK